MKRQLSVLVSVLVVVAMMFTLASCEWPFGEKHEHEFSADWSYDATNHWHAATCEDNDECKSAIADSAAHTFGEDNKCSVCGYEKPAEDKPVDPNPPVETPTEGTKENPIALTVPGELTISYVPNENSDPVWYTFTAAEDATLGVTLSANGVMGYGVDADDVAYTDGVTYVEFDITAGTKYYVNFSTTDLAAGDITVKAEYVVEVGIGDLTGTYEMVNEWNQKITVVVVTNEDLLGGTVTINAKGMHGDAVVVNYEYKVEEVDGEQAVVLYTNGAAVTNRMFGAIDVENGKIVGGAYDGYDYTVVSGGDVVVPATGFEGTYTATNSFGDVWTIVITSDSIEITTVGFMGTEVIAAGPYTVEDGAFTPTSDTFENITLTFNEEKVLTGLYDAMGDITFTVTVGGETPDPETGYEGDYVAENSFGESINIGITSTELTVSISGWWGTDVYTVEYTVDESGMIVLDLADTDLDGWAFTFDDSKKLTGVVDNNSSEYTVKDPNAVEPDSEEAPIEIEISASEPTYVAGSSSEYGSIYYTFTANATGLLTVTFPTADFAIDYYDVDHLYDVYPYAVDTATLEVRSGVTYIIKFMSLVSFTKAPTVTLTFVEGALPEEGDFEKPFEAYDTDNDWTDDIVCSFPATEDNTKFVWYKYSIYTGGTVTVVFDKAVNVKHGLTEADAVTLTGVTTFTFTVDADINYYFAVQTTDLAAADITMSISSEAPKGSTESNPFDAVVGENEYSYKSGNLFFAYTPAADGKITFLINGASAFIYNSSYSIFVDAVNGVAVTIDAVKDDKLIISISNYDADRNVVPVDGKFTVTPESAKPTFVAGQGVYYKNGAENYTASKNDWAAITSDDYVKSSANVAPAVADGVMSFTTSKWGYVLFKNDAAVDGKTHVFETDIMIDDITAWAGTTSYARFATITLTAAADGAMSRAGLIIYVNTVKGDDGVTRIVLAASDYTETLAKEKIIATLEEGQWINLRVEYTEAEELTANPTANIYVNNELVIENSTAFGGGSGKALAGKLTGFGIECRDATEAGYAGATFNFANTYMGTYVAPPAPALDPTEGKYTATTEAMMAVTPINVEITETSIILTYTTMGRDVTETFTYVVTDGALVITDPYGEVVTDPLYIALTFTENVPTAMTYNGNEYTVAKATDAPVIPPVVEDTKGTEADPNELTIPGTAVAGGDTDKTLIWYTFTAEKDGKVTIVFDGTTSWVRFKNSEDKLIDNATGNYNQASYVYEVTAGETYKVALGVWTAVSTAPTATFTFEEKKEEEVTPGTGITLQLGTYTATQGWTVVIDATNITITYKNPYYGAASTRVDNATYTKDDTTCTIVVMGTTNGKQYIVTYDTTGLITKVAEKNLTSGSETSYNLTLTTPVENTPTATLGNGNNIDQNGWTGSVQA